VRRDGGVGVTKLWIWSDPHYEQNDTMTAHPAPDHDVCVIAGDFSYLEQAVETLSAEPGHWIGNHQTVYVPGNHEFYKTRRGSMESAERAAAEAAAASRLFLLNPGEVVLNGIRFLGCTMWTDFALYSDLVNAMADAQIGMNDFNRMRTEEGAPPGKAIRFTPEHAFRRHIRERKWLESKLAEPFDGPTVVVTHHGPSPKSVPDRFEGDPLTPAFSSNLEHIIRQYQPAAWIHGHTHDSFDYMIGKTRVICNPAGYPHEPNPDFVPDLVIEIDDYEPTATMKM
jgi:predicted phosphodiesterase